MKKTKNSIIYKDTLAYFENLVDKVNKLDDLSVKTKSGEKIYKSEIHLLVRIHENPNQNMSEIARSTNVTRGMISQLANKLEKKGLVEKRKSPSNERDVLLHITEEGKQMVERHSNYHEELNSHFIDYFNSLNTEQVETILNFLKVTETVLDETINSQVNQ